MLEGPDFTSAEIQHFEFGIPWVFKVCPMMVIHSVINWDVPWTFKTGLKMDAHNRLDLEVPWTF